MKRLALAVLLLVAAPARAADDDFGGGSVVFAREGALWRTDPKGKGPATELIALPDGAAASDVRMIRSDAAGRVLVVDVGGTWWWGKPGGTLAKLPCADAPARPTADGRVVICADDRGRALLVGLVTGKVVRWPAPAEGARIVVRDGVRSLIYADDRGVWVAPLLRPKARVALAPEPPRRGFLAAPDGGRAAAIHEGEVFEKKKQKVAGEVLDGYALDGTAARRQLHRDGVVVDWSWDSQWLLVQAGEEACVTRATGGQYKCWKGYQAMSLAPDGAWAILLGKRRGESDDTLRSVYRGKLAGAYTERPALVETVVDGAAAWLPGAP